MMKVELFGNLEKVVKKLIELREKGISAYCEFNGHKLYSDTVTLDSAYLEVTGYTYREFLDARKRQIEKWERQEQEEKEAAKDKKPEWIKRGRKLIDQKLWAEWEECIDIRIRDLYNGREVEDSLKVMEAYEVGLSIADIVKMLDDQGHSGMSYSMVMCIIEYFYRKGEELVKKIKAFEDTPGSGKKF